MIRTSGSSFAYLIGFLLSPIIARIYQPEAYGEFAVFNALVANLSVFATLNLINAFVLPRDNQQFIPLVQLTLMVILLVTVIITLALLLFGNQVLAFFNVEGLGGLIYLIPVFVFFTGLNRCLDYWNVRETEYKKGATAKVASVIGAKTFTIVLGILTKGNVLGFLLGDLLSRPIHSYTLLSKSIRSSWKGLRKISFQKIKRVAKEYKNYPLYNMPASGLIVLSSQLPVYLLSWFFGSVLTGHFSLAYSLISAPIQVLGMSVASVFYQKAVDIRHNQPAQLTQVTAKLFNRLAMIGALPFGVLIVFGETLFIAVFGANWEVAGTFASYMGIMAYTNFLSVSLTSLFRVIRKEKLHFVINLVGAACLSLGLFMAINFGTGYQLVMVFSVIGTAINLVSIAIACSLVKINPVIAIVKLAVSIVVAVGILYALSAT